MCMTIYFDKLDKDITSASVPCGIVELTARPGVYRNFVKRIFDLSVVLVLAPIIVPLIAVLALIVARDGSSPFYTGKRVGKNGREFEMPKIRTMVTNADKLLDKHLAENPQANAEWESTQKLKDDPRITRVGKLLRKTSLDELPQLWNVFTGEMSLVGPRPMLSCQRSIYPGLSYYALKPGITGPWQVSDRNDCEFSKRADHDKFYDENLSFSNDIRILFRTVGVVVKGTGY